MTARSLTLWILVALGPAGFAVPQTPPATPAPATPAPEVDLEQEREAVRAVERAFSEMVTKKEKDRLTSFFLPDAIFHSQVVSRGPEAILGAWAPFFDPQREIRLAWEPREIRVAESGEIAWSSGGATVHMLRAWGEMQTREDQYLTLWRKDAQGAWKIWANGTLVVYPDGSEVRDLRRAVSGFWDPLAQLDAEVDFSWKPDVVLEAESGELAFTVGTYRVEVGRGDTARAGSGGYFTVWKKIREKKDFDPRWVVAAESFSPPTSE